MPYAATVLAGTAIAPNWAAMLAVKQWLVSVIFPTQQVALRVWTFKSVTG